MSIGHFFVLTRCTDSFIVGLTVRLLGEYIETYHSSELGLTVRLLGLSAFDWKAELTHRPCAVAGKLSAILQTYATEKGASLLVRIHFLLSNVMI